jgi:hypothetical protein
MKADREYGQGVAEDPGLYLKKVEKLLEMSREERVKARSQ